MAERDQKPSTPAPLADPRCRNCRPACGLIFAVLAGEGGASIEAERRSRLYKSPQGSYYRVYVDDASHVQPQKLAREILKHVYPPDGEPPLGAVTNLQLIAAGRAELIRRKNSPDCISDGTWRAAAGRK
jgi:hypothetical protein